MNISDMGANEWLLIAAAVVGPILAVQAQKAVERARDKSLRRDHVFRVLMATRQARLSPDHVQALNSIDLAFYGRRVLGRAIRGTASQTVIDNWDTYRRHLSPTGEARPTTPEQHAAWRAKGDELFVNLLESIALANRYKFDRQSLQTGSYSPQAHEDLEIQQRMTQIALLEVLSGQRPMPMEIRQWPIDPAVGNRARDVQEAISRALTRLADKFDPQQGDAQ